MSNDFKVDVKPVNKSKRHQWSFGKKLVGRKRRRSWKMSAASRDSEYFPLMSDEDQSDDDDQEIVTVHNSSIFRLRQRNSPNKRSPEVSPDDGSSSESASSKIGNGFKSDSKSKTDPFLNREMITVKIKDGDTLQSISLKYRCSISDIKRANNLISDQDFYALQFLKVPVRKHGILSQALADLPASTSEICDHEKEDSGNSNARVIDLGLKLSNNSPQEAANFLKRMDEDLVKIVLNSKSQKNSLEPTAAATLGSPNIQPLVNNLYGNHYIICNIHWSYVLFFMVVISIVALVVIFYIDYVRTSPNSILQNQTYSDDLVDDYFSSSQKTIDFGIT